MATVAEKMTAIADAIRDKTGGTEPLTLDGMATAIAGIEGGGGGTQPDPRDQYQRVEYITSDSESYCVTDFVADNTCGMELVAAFPNFADRVCMGSREDSNNTRFFSPYPLSATGTYFGFNTAQKISTSALTVGAVYRMQANLLNSRIATVHDVSGNSMGSKEVSGTLTAQTFPIYIFTYSYKGSSTSSRAMTLYSARCSRGNDIVREYIPCYRKSDGEIGLYEKFTGTFLGNAGSGEFTKGADIAWDV